MRPNEGETAAAADYVERMQLDLTVFLSPYSIMLMLFGTIQPPASVVLTYTFRDKRQVSGKHKLYALRAELAELHDKYNVRSLHTSL